MIKIYGHSDDCIEIDGDVEDEIGEPRTITVGGEGEGVEIIAKYGKNGVWEFALRMVDEDVPVPWPIRIVTEHGYSLAVIIDCPPGTPVSWDSDDEENEDE